MKKLVTAAVAIVMPCAAASQLLPAVDHAVRTEVMLAAALDTSNTSVGISDPYLSYGFGDIEGDIADMAAMGVTNIRVQIY